MRNFSPDNVTYLSCWAQSLVTADMRPCSLSLMTGTKADGNFPPIHKGRRHPGRYRCTGPALSLSRRSEPGQCGEPASGVPAGVQVRAGWPRRLHGEQQHRHRRSSYQYCRYDDSGSALQQDSERDPTYVRNSPTRWAYTWDATGRITAIGAAGSDGPAVPHGHSLCPCCLGLRDWHTPHAQHARYCGFTWPLRLRLDSSYRSIRWCSSRNLERA